MNRKGDNLKGNCIICKGTDGDDSGKGHLQGEVIGTYQYEKIGGAIIPCHFLEKNRPMIPCVH